MSKLYVFGIGGTGSRVLRSLTMLLAAGVDCGVNTIVPIIIERDKGNGDFTRVDGLIRNYMSINNIVTKKDEKGKNIKNRFFNTEINLLGNELLLNLDYKQNEFKDFIGLITQSPKNKALSEMLFSENTLDMDTEWGFKGNPDMGSIVLNQFDDNDIFRAFASDFQDGDKIFIISSIFGGTGASGFPLLRKMLQTKNLTDTSDAALSSWGIINNAPIGAISVLPYFTVDKVDKIKNVDSDTFNDKTRTALSYYESENGKLDTLYYIADTNRKTYKYAEGGSEQKNDAHFVELAAAMSILDFVNADKKNINFQKDNSGNRKTIYKEFGINSDVSEISFDNLAAETQKLIVNPLSRFMLFAKYMGYAIVKKLVDGEVKYEAERVCQYDIFSKENKYQPYAHRRFDGDFRNKIANLENVQRLFFDWLQEMTQQSRKFLPFNLTTADAFNFVHGQISLFTKKDSVYKNWAKVDNELNHQIIKTNSSLEDVRKFIELFYRTTEALIDQTTQNSGAGNAKYIFRLQSEGDYGLMNTIEHWGVSDMYGEKQRKAITSSNEYSFNQPTSIPSPFARIALVKTAFGEVARYGEKALNAYQKIVSDSLDVAEIFFTFDKWKEKVEIIQWKYGRQDNNQELADDSDLRNLQPGHWQLYKTLKTFLENDAVAYNFDKMKGIYILKYKTKGDMIGATSPCTLFFSSANDYNKPESDDIKVKKDIYLNGQRKAFDGIVPLHKRAWVFQQYLYSWKAVNNENRTIGGRATSVFDEFNKYLEAQKTLINRTNEIDQLRSIDTNLYKELTPVEVLGKPIHQLKQIPPEYWSADDILEDVIIRLPFKINKESFFDNNLPDDCEKFYLLPIKDKFFKEYSIEKLKKFISINHSGDVAIVEVKLDNQQAPIKKMYQKSNNTLIEHDFDCMLFPNVNFATENEAYYRFGLFLPSIKINDTENYTVEFYIGNNKLILEKPVVRNTIDKQNSICKIYSLDQKTFDKIKININGANGILLPALHSKIITEDFTFAVDIGTTNTHVEYKTNANQQIRPFDIQETDKQTSFLCGNNTSYTLVGDIDFIPALIGQNPFKFPVRTALSLQQAIEQDAKIFPFAHANVLIPYEKRQIPAYNNVLTQLKWDSTEAEMGYFIDSLCFMLRNKVILNNGKLNETKIVWFYPLSMAGTRANKFRKKWELAYSKYFLGIAANDVTELGRKQTQILKKNIIELPESVAPFLYYKDDIEYKETINNCVSIDIGGGTTDIVFIEDGINTKFTTSFRFAANSVFGLGEYITPIVSKYQPDIEEIIIDEGREAKYNYLFDNIYKGITGDTQKGDIASFFFSLKNHEQLRNVEIDYNSKLSGDKDQKLIFVLFYAAIIYHTAQIMKAKELKLPRHIVFSGNGSRIVNIIGEGNVLAELSKCIFKKVFGIINDEWLLDIVLNTRNPKEVTCKGGIKAADKNYRQMPFNHLVLLGTDNNTFASTDSKYSSLDIEDSVTKTYNHVKGFVKYIIDELMSQNYTRDLVPESYLKALEINSQTLQFARDVITREEDLANFTRSGIKDKIYSLGDSAAGTQIEETFFFYPITSLLKVISREINTRMVSKKD